MHMLKEGRTKLKTASCSGHPPLFSRILVAENFLQLRTFLTIGLLCFIASLSKGYASRIERRIDYPVTLTVLICFLTCALDTARHLLE